MVFYFFIAICELCGRVGRRGQFYSRNNKFCSLRCHVSSTRRRYCNWKYKLMEGADHMAGLIPLEPLPQLQHWQETFNDLQVSLNFIFILIQKWNSCNV